MNKLRNLLYRMASILGDVNAVRTGRVGRRVVSKIATRSANKVLRDILRGR